MKVYTKTGDNGTTSIVGGTRLSKADIRIDVYGTIDELNANIGLLLNYIDKDADKETLNRIQKELFQVGSIYCTDWSKFDGSKYIIQEDCIDILEQTIDQMDADLPKLKDFVMPGGSLASSHAHIARTICRRAERLAVAYYEDITLVYEKPVDLGNDLLQPQSATKPNENLTNYLLRGMRYLNRLSDYLFVLSRKYMEK